MGDQEGVRTKRAKAASNIGRVGTGSVYNVLAVALTRAHRSHRGHQVHSTGEIPPIVFFPRFGRSLLLLVGCSHPLSEERTRDRDISVI